LLRGVSVPCALLLGFSIRVTATYVPTQPSAEVAIVRYIWHDSARNRDIPVQIYYPTSGERPLPIVIFSHGLGGTREGYEYLGRYWAGCRYISVHVQHLGSDDSVWKGKPFAEVRASMEAAVAKPDNALNRPRDVSFAIEQLLQLNSQTGNPLSGRLDSKRIAVAGHSFGAWTTLAIAGEGVGPTHISLADPRVKAAIVMSPPVAKGQRHDTSAFSTIGIPVLYLTGTQDDSPIGDTRAADRRIPFDHTSGAAAFFVNFVGADHMTFARHVRPSESPNDDRFHGLITKTTTAYLDAYVRDDASARQWLIGHEINAALGPAASVEKRP